MDKPGPATLGSFAILKNGSTHGALVDLLASTVAMLGFMGQNQPKEKVLDIWDDMIKASREHLVSILEEEEKLRE